MKNENWITRVQQAEELPPAHSWNSIQSKRRWKSYQKWAIASCSALIVFGLGWAVLSNSVVSDVLPSAQAPNASTPFAVAQVQAPASTNSKISSPQTAQLEPTTPLVSAENQISPTENIYSIFPYNGSVNSTKEKQSEKQNEKQSEKQSEKHSERHSEPEETPIEETQQATSEFEFVTDEMPTMDFFDWYQIPNIFTPNQDGMNDIFSPMEYIPFWARGNWAIYKDGQLIRALSKEESWDGNHANGMEIPDGLYVIELQYINAQKDSNFSKKTLMVKLMR